MTLDQLNKKTKQTKLPNQSNYIKK